ncbi:macrolide family glycosyltransferase [Streptomyces boncukensis]|uniref:Glycosyl transferase n=1 Tax=Streptomyces boncukensis TaxID=2711219 RepID=A0A6G4X7U4_9ACTN|nr:macrolide family glycosyltransferase [Streptomyces boncukensis]NGO73458.1 glycosyl transferase [Streptomyces boncukensis]
MPRTAPAHIAMFNIAASGHVHPGLEVIRELVARGHRVSYAVPPAMADLVAATGAEPKPYTSSLPTDDPADWGSGLLDNIRPFLDDAVQALPQLAKVFEGDVPDLVLSDSTSYPARVLAHRWGVPQVQLTTHMVAWEGYVPEDVAPEYAEMKRSAEGQAYYARFRAWLDEHGIARDVDEFAGIPRRAVVLIPKAMQPNAALVDEERYTFVGTCSTGAARTEEWRRPEGAEGSRLLLVSLGSTFTAEPEFYRACVEAYGDLPGWYVVLQIGRHVDPAVLGPLPSNIETHPWVPQLAILGEADAFVTHAGMGGSQEGLATGTPMIAVPQAADQFMNAALLEGLGVARHLPKERATAEALRSALEELTGDPEVARRLAEIQRRTLAEGGATRAADVIESELP